MTQRDIVKKADLAVSDLVSGGGYLQTEQVQTFLRMVKDQPTLLRDCRRINMKSHTREVDKIGFTSRLLAPGTEATALNANARKKPTLGKVLLTTNKMMAEVHIDYETLEDNIEKGNLEQVIMQEMAKQVALDLEELILLGDTTNSSDPYLALQNGVLASATQHVVATTGAISKATFSAGVKEMPAKYLRNRSQFRWYVSNNNEIDYRDSLGNRETAVGDSLIEGFRGVYHHGIPVVPVAMMPESKAILTRPDNICWGVWRDIMVETDRDIRSQVYIIVLSLRAGMVLEEPDAIVVMNGIGTQASSGTSGGTSGGTEGGTSGGTSGGTEGGTSGGTSGGTEGTGGNG